MRVLLYWDVYPIPSYGGVSCARAVQGMTLLNETTKKNKYPLPNTTTIRAGVVALVMASCTLCHTTARSAQLLFLLLLLLNFNLNVYFSFGFRLCRSLHEVPKVECGLKFHTNSKYHHNPFLKYYCSDKPRHKSDIKWPCNECD